MTEILKRCPLCGGGLVVRTNRENGAEFLACTRWRGNDPDSCAHTERVPESYRLRAAGFATLPGME